MKEVRITFEGNNIRQITDVLKKEMDMVYQYESDDFYVLMKEEYYMRVKSKLLTVFIIRVDNNEEVEIALVSGGGQDGGNMDWGAENSENRRTVRTLIELCKSHGWEVTGLSPKEFEDNLYRTNKELLVDAILKPFRKER